MRITKGQQKNNKINFKEVSSNYLLDSKNSKILKENSGQNNSKYHVLINLEIIKNDNLKRDLKSFIYDKQNPDKSLTVGTFDNAYLFKKRLKENEIKEIIEFIERLFIFYGNDIEHETSIVYFPNGKTIISKSEYNN